MTEYQATVSKYFNETDRVLAEEYCRKYWLNDLTYKEKWQSIQDKIFDPAADSISDGIIRKGFSIIPFIGGGVFTESEFARWKECMVSTKDREFVVIQSRLDTAAIRVWSATQGEYKEDNWHKFVYPADITWNAITSGGLFSEEMICSPMREWFIFGDSGAWGRYDANEHDSPIDIIAFKPEYEDLFRSTFRLEDKFRADVKKYTPEVYKKWIDW